jgi:hypothetical protein
MKRTWTIISVQDVPASLHWYIRGLEGLFVVLNEQLP